MSRINILLAVPAAQMYGQFIPMRTLPTVADPANITADEQAAIDAYEASISGIPENVYRTVVDGIEGRWKTASINSTDYKLASIIITDSEGPSLIETFSPDAIILGAWNQDGTQYGQYYEQIQTGTEVIDGIETPTYDFVVGGSPVYPSNFDTIARFLRDIVDYDAYGNEISRTPKMNLLSEPVVSGWSPRQI